MVGRSGLFGLSENIEDSWEIMVNNYKEMTSKSVSDS